MLAERAAVSDWRITSWSLEVTGTTGSRPPSTTGLAGWRISHLSPPAGRITAVPGTGVMEALWSLTYF